MSDKISIKELRDQARRGHGELIPYGELVPYGELLALVNAVEAAKTLVESGGYPPVEWDTEPLLAALARFDFA